MHPPYRALHTRPTVPDMPVDPPEPTDEVYERNCRNLLREEICEVIDHLDSRLGELEPKGFNQTLAGLAELRDYLRRDMEE